MPNYDVLAKQYFPMINHYKNPNVWNLALKMSTWQPWLAHQRRSGLVCIFNATVMRVRIVC